MPIVKNFNVSIKWYIGELSDEEAKKRIFEIIEDARAKHLTLIRAVVPC